MENNIRYYKSSGANMNSGKIVLVLVLYVGVWSLIYTIISHI